MQMSQRTPFQEMKFYFYWTLQLEFTKDGATILHLYRGNRQGPQRDDWFPITFKNLTRLWLRVAWHKLTGR